MYLNGETTCERDEDGRFNASIPAVLAGWRYAESRRVTTTGDSVKRCTATSMDCTNLADGGRIAGCSWGLESFQVTRVSLFRSYPHHGYHSA